jgi:hypothetical protein
MQFRTTNKRSTLVETSNLLGDPIIEQKQLTLLGWTYAKYSLCNRCFIVKLLKKDKKRPRNAHVKSTKKKVFLAHNTFSFKQTVIYANNQLGLDCCASSLDISGPIICMAICAADKPQ